MSLFAPVDTFDTSTFLRAVVQPGGSSTVERFLLPVTGLENNGQPVTPKGFGSLYGLFLTIDATLAANSFTSLNVTLWADPKNDARHPGVSETSDPAFANGMANDIVLATGTLVSASLSLDPATGSATRILWRASHRPWPGACCCMGRSSRELCSTSN